MRIDFYCTGNVPFSPEILWNRGLGGSEYAIVLLAEELGRENEVTVWNETLGYIRYGHVAYRPIGECDLNLKTDLFVIFRVSIPGRPPNAERVAFFSCDQTTDGEWAWGRMWPWLERFVCISRFHASYICQTYPVSPSILRVCELGVNIADYLCPEEKVRGRMIFCSVPHRGLGQLFQIWPNIVERIPEASLVATCDYRLWGRSNDPANHEFVQAAKRLQNVSVLGAVNRRDLIHFQKQAEIFAYPCTYPENFSISAAEAIAAGAVPVSTRMGALPTTIGKSGILVDEAETPEGQERFVDELVGLYYDRPRLEKLRSEGMARARRHYSFQSVARRFLRACR